MAKQIFILSPAHCGGERARLIYNDEANFDLAKRVRTAPGASLGEVFSFLSGLYFRGKLAYAQAFCKPPKSGTGVLVITTNRGLVPAETMVMISDLRAMACGNIHSEDPGYRTPLERDARTIAKAVGKVGRVVLLGSIATGKYVDILQDALGSRLAFPAEFVGRGDMSRGGLMLRCVDDNRELSYIAVDGAVRRGTRPPKLARRRPRKAPCNKVTSPAAGSAMGRNSYAGVPTRRRGSAPSIR